VSAEPDPAYDEFRHEALLYRGMTDFVDRTVPFIRGGLEAGESVAVVTSAEHIDALRHSLGSHAGAVAFADMADVGTNPALIIPFWQDFIATHDGRSLRGIGEPIWAGRSAAELVECQRHESLLNFAVDPAIPLWLLCPYDTAGLDPEVIDEARHSHPYVTEGLTRQESGAFRGVGASAAPFAAPLSEPPSVATVFRFGSRDLAVVRGIVAAGAASAGLDGYRAHDLVVAAHEIATNSVRHGGGAGVLKVWPEEGALICDFSDGGHIDDPLADRRQPSSTAAGGRGLWLANQLCDLVQIRSHRSGTQVRLHVRR
jgi:anti-sigma regulatory factor (Ser/Thr protein kinase)